MGIHNQMQLCPKGGPGPCTVVITSYSVSMVTHSLGSGFSSYDLPKLVLFLLITKSAFTPNLFDEYLTNCDAFAFLVSFVHAGVKAVN